MAKATDTPKVPTSEERIATLEAALKKVQTEWEAYKKVSPFYKQTQQPVFHKQRPPRV